jgi:hypothetical protein
MEGARDSVLNLDLSHGKRFEAELFEKCCRITHEQKGSGQFFLLATFRRYLFQLNEESVALALESCLRGYSRDFCVAFQSHNHFRFLVSCKAVGFEIFKLRRFIG